MRDAGLATPPDEVLHTFLGPAIEHTLRELTGLPHDDPEVLALRDAYRARYHEEGVRMTTTFAGVPEALDALAAAGHELAVVTSKVEPIAHAVLAATGLLDRFAHLAAPAPDALAEPKTATLARALAALGRHDATMVGDRRHDVEAARAHGLRAIGVLWWDNPHAGELAAADAVARVPGELPGLV